MRSLVLLLSVLLLSTSTAAARRTLAGNFTWSLCPGPEPPFQSGVFNVTLQPPQPVAGQTAVLSVSASTDAVPAAGASRDDFGFAAVSVSFHGLPIYSLSRPLCDVAVAAAAAGGAGRRIDGDGDGDDASCPFTGPYELRWEQDFPELTPAGRYHLRLEARESQPEEGEREREDGGGGALPLSSPLSPQPRRALSLSSSSSRGGGYSAAGPEILCIEIAFDVVRPAS